MKKSLLVLLAALGLLLGFTAPANAGTAKTAGAGSTSVSTGAAGVVPCSPSRGHYCAKVLFRSVSGGVRITKTLSTGYTRGRGQAREYFRYSCNAGTCYTLPTRVFYYNRALVQLNVTRRFGGAGFFAPCGTVLGVDYIRPAFNDPGPRPILFRVTCSKKTGAGSL